MKVWKAIATQRAVREFQLKSIEPRRLDRIVDAGRRAPSSNNDQRWRFIVVTDPVRLELLSKVGAWARHVSAAPAAIALVTPEASEAWEAESVAFDLGQAAQNMMLAAWEMGIGSAHAGVYYHEVAQELLGYPQGWRCDYLIAFGYPRKPITPDARHKVTRLPMSEVRHNDIWTRAEKPKKPPVTEKRTPQRVSESEGPGYQA